MRSTDVVSSLPRPHPETSEVELRGRLGERGERWNQGNERLPIEVSHSPSPSPAPDLSLVPLNLRPGAVPLGSRSGHFPWRQEIGKGDRPPRARKLASNYREEKLDQEPDPPVPTGDPARRAESRPSGRSSAADQEMDYSPPSDK